MMKYPSQIHLLWCFENSVLAAVFYLCMASLAWEGNNGIFYCLWKDSEPYFPEWM